MKKLQLLIVAGAVLALAAACDDEQSCSQDTDCPSGDICLDGTCSTPGTDECAINLDCSNGQVCNNGTCEDPSGCVTSFDCDGFFCDADGTCATTCDDTIACGAGYVCDAGGVCTLETIAPYDRVLIISRTSVEDDIDNTTPGPDIDAIHLIVGGVPEGVAVVDASQQGDEGSDGNNFDDVQTILGLSDAIPGGNENCDLTHTPTRFWSMGGGSADLGDIGYAIVSFGADVTIPDGAEIRTFELNDQSCPNIAVERDDNYEIYVGSADSDLATPLTATGWILLGGTEGDGGESSFFFAEPAM